jgi:hypothetical protein
VAVTTTPKAGLVPSLTRSTLQLSTASA